VRDKKQWQREFECADGKVYGIVGPPPVPEATGRREVRGLLGFRSLRNCIRGARCALLRLERSGGEFRCAIAALQEAYRSYHRLGGSRVYIVVIVD
jgi:hypothetical protein